MRTSIKMESLSKDERALIQCEKTTTFMYNLQFYFDIAYSRKHGPVGPWSRLAFLAFVVVCRPIAVR